MADDSTPSGDTSTTEIRLHDYIEPALRIGALFLVIYWVTLIVAPFIPAIMWAIIIAVACYPLFVWLSAALGGREKTAATLITVFALILIILPATWLGQASVEWGTAQAQKINEGTLTIPTPPDRVAEWPLIGERVYEYWTLASTNLEAAVSQAESQLRSVGEWLLRTVAGVGMGILQFALSIIIAGVLLANAATGSEFAGRIFGRLIPGSGDSFVVLAEQTIRSVAAGVIGVALIQGALIGAGLLLMGVPGTPILITAVVLLGIVQLPATLVTIPVLIWVWGSQETLPALLFTIYIIPAGLADNVLKPLLLGRGVEAPMLVIFIGAIGGFILSGIIGLFVGAVVLVLAYTLFEAWLASEADVKMPEAVARAVEKES